MKTRFQWHKHGYAHLNALWARASSGTWHAWRSCQTPCSGNPCNSKWTWSPLWWQIIKAQFYMWLYSLLFNSWLKMKQYCRSIEQWIYLPEGLGHQVIPFHLVDQHHLSVQTPQGCQEHHCYQVDLGVHPCLEHHWSLEGLGYPTKRCLKFEYFIIKN